MLFVAVQVALHFFAVTVLRRACWVCSAALRRENGSERKRGISQFPLLFFSLSPRPLLPFCSPPSSRRLSRLCYTPSPTLGLCLRKMLSFFATTLLLGASSSLGALAGAPGHALAPRAPHANAGPTPALFARQATATIPSLVSATATATATTSRLSTGTASRPSGAATGSVPMSPLASLSVFPFSVYARADSLSAALRSGSLPPSKPPSRRCRPTPPARSHRSEARPDFLPVRPAPFVPSNSLILFPPVVNLNPAQYPALDVHAPADSSTVRQWISEINLAGAPSIPINGLNGCQNTTFNAAAVANASSAGTCQLTRANSTKCGN